MRYATLGFALIGVGLVGIFFSNSDSYLRDRTVKIITNTAECSGIQIVAPSGTNYILTAAHCRELMDGTDEYTVDTEKGLTLQRRFVAEDDKSDLLLIEGVPSLEGLSIADNELVQSTVKIFSHGANLDTWKAEGDLVQLAMINVPIYPIQSDDQATTCGKTPKYLAEDVDIFFGIMAKYCMLHVTEMVSTAMVVPGSSGAGVLDSSGKIVGIVSASNGTFSFLVPLNAIHEFLKGY